MESTFPLLTLMAVVPMFGALALWLVRPLAPLARPLGLACAAGPLLLVAVAFCQFDTAQAGAVQLGERYAWVPALGISWALGVTGLGLTMLGLTAFLVPLVLVAAWRDFDQVAPGEDVDRRRAAFTALVLALQSFIVIIFSARDVFLFYIAFEAMLVPAYFLVGSYGGAKRRAAALKFLLFSLFGGLIMLVGVVALGALGPGGQTAFLIDTLTIAPVEGPAGRLIFVSFFIAFAIKAPMVPVHTWLPDTAEQSHPGVATLLVGLLDKIGTFGMIVLCLPLFPEASRWAAPVIIVLALVSVIYGALLAIGQRDLMRLVSYTSISHFGFIVLGIFIGNATALSGAMLYMLAHGLSIALMFLTTGFLTRRAGSQQISDFCGMQRITPVLAGLWLFGGLASIALPGLSGFVPEYLVLMGVLSTKLWVGIVAMAGVVLAALYILWPYQRVFAGPPAQGPQLTDLNKREIGALAPLVLAVMLLGLAPQVTALKYLAPVADQTVVNIAPVPQTPLPLAERTSL
ncbi:NADH-quinone oxidoreductase subunit M [Buchananella hordeovulneris]|uniref:NADH-quinone oxidoreductase subunit M n=1 Tax=Buchananella hordeovulneris TaxID=52770 RepID=UPI000F5FEEE4|nr:NADH-quinone oxidoreductase subunit M [Buchananella hordeovulneris]MDO5081019.1 NADH-quinone oxidoreductase subunit M [Buchananella hordeovulneris]RRD49374.1 NADH-quinone oxidoreductase subunit M [Buchananella hordeovulneris]